jgi:hypothetical protein
MSDLTRAPIWERLCEADRRVLWDVQRRLHMKATGGLLCYCDNTLSGGAGPHTFAVGCPDDPKPPSGIHGEGEGST